MGGIAESMWAKRPASRYQPRATSLPRPHSIEPAAAKLFADPAQTATPVSTRLSQRDTFSRFEQICARIHWKAMDLESAGERVRSPDKFGFNEVLAERNYKLDFYEFYTWVEKALVLVQLLYGVHIPRGEGWATGGSSSQQHHRGPSSGHAYHHNVLQALEDGENPLREVLGQGHAKQALWKAKELRNRWKDVAEEKSAPPLKMYDPKWIVERIVEGMNGAYLMAKEKVEEEERQGMTQEVDMEGFEWMTEEMDWEA